MSDFDQAVGYNLRALRKAKRWTLQETVERMGVELGRTISIAGYSRWETERSSWTSSELLAMCTTFEVPLARLLLPNIDDPWQDQDAVGVWNTLFAFTSHVRPWWPLQHTSSLR